MPSLPTPFRAALGLAAQVAEEARHLPDKAVELPMLAVSTALQMSLRLQQRYAMLAARGDELLNRRETTDEPPPWATFDAPVDAPRGTRVDTVIAPTPIALEDEHDIPRKTVHRPRTGRPSAFDAVGDE